MEIYHGEVFVRSRVVQILMEITKDFPCKIEKAVYWNRNDEVAVHDISFLDGSKDQCTWLHLLN